MNSARPRLQLVLALALSAATFAAAARAQEMSPLEAVLQRAQTLLDIGDLEGVERESVRALERDPASIEAWRLRATWAERAGRRDEHVWALHRRLALAIAQGMPRDQIQALQAELVAADPLARERFGLREIFVAQLLPIVERYEKDGRRHSAILVHREILSIDPERAESQAAIDRLAAAPDPSLAEDARPRDLLEGVSGDWLRGFDKDHATWATRARLERDNYVTLTNAGYEVMVRAAEAMEQMSAFYRRFFNYGIDGGSVSRIELRIFRTRDEYLRHGSSPVEWSAGQFTGAAVETYVGPGGIAELSGTLFHEAAHQFVSLATNATGWLNEGLASFFEGSRLLANGTVQMNLPANHRLFPLAQRMDAGWMKDHTDGIDASNANSVPRTAPTFRTVLEDRYTWGPPWYAPTWGVVYFLYNYQHPVDGRYLYRPAFREFINKSGGRMGEGAVKNFEDVVLANPTTPTPGVVFPPDAFKLPRTTLELDPVWKAWVLALRDEQSGRLEVERPWLEWARYALRRKEWDIAAEHFEKGHAAAANDVALLVEFGDFLAGTRGEPDRATKLFVRAAALVDNAEPRDTKLLAKIENKLAAADPNRKSLDKVHTAIHASARSLVERYLAEGLDLMAMDLALGFGTALNAPGMRELYTAAIERSGKTLSLWTLAYNERDLAGWTAAGEQGWTPNREVLGAQLGEYQADAYDYRFLTLDAVTSGDFSMEAEIMAVSGEAAFAGLVFGRKSVDSFHAYLLFPPRKGREGAAQTGFVDLTTFYGPGQFKVWRHTPVVTDPKEQAGTSAGERWHKLRVDVVGDLVDVWFDGEYVASQLFQSVDVLRGNFGLITGPGKAQFRNVRYLARSGRDFGAALERDKRLADLAASGEAIGGGYLGLVPPFPQPKRWVKPADGAPLPESFADLGLAPKLLVLWSIQQNDLMPLHTWLRHLENKYKDVGLRIVSIASATDADGLDAYLANHRFPGLVGVDGFDDGFGIGRLFTQYAIDRFNLPRLLLLGLDSKVVWEGDPGFVMGAAWQPGEVTYLDDPLESLVVQSKLRQLIPWRNRYAEKAVPAIEQGRFLDALPILKDAEDFDGRRDAAVAEAQGRLAIVRTAASGWETTASALVQQGASAALPTLLAWGEAVGATIDPKDRRKSRDVLEPADARGFERIVADLEKLVANAGRKHAADPTPLVEALRAHPAPFVAALADEAAALGKAPSAADLGAFLTRVTSAPGAWLVHEYFRW